MRLLIEHENHLDPAVGEDHSVEITPFEACLGCCEERTITAVGFIGTPEWIISEVAQVAGISLSEAHAAFLLLAGHASPSEEPLPGARTLVACRLCHECAKNGGVVVREIGTTAGIPVYEQAPTDGRSIEPSGRVI